MADAPKSYSSIIPNWPCWSRDEWARLTDEDARRLPCGPGALDQVDANGRHILMAALVNGCPPRHLLKLLLLGLACEPFARVMSREDHQGVRLAAYLIRYLPENVVMDRGCWVVLHKYSHSAHITPVINQNGDGLLVQLSHLALQDDTPWVYFLQAQQTSCALRLDVGQWQAGVSERMIDAFTANGAMTQMARGHLPPSLYGASKALTRLYYQDQELGRVDLWRPSLARLVRVSEWVKMLTEDKDIDKHASFLETDRFLLSTFDDMKDDMRALWAHMEDPQSHVVRSIMLARNHHTRWEIFERSLSG